MAKRSTIIGSVALAAVLAGLVLRATTLHSIAYAPLIYRAVANVNDLDTVEGSAPPGSYVALWARQRNFKEGNLTDDPFAWCAWKNGGSAYLIGWTYADAAGVWRLSNLRTQGTTVMMFPPAPAGDRCVGGVYTELLPIACDSFTCSTWQPPTLHWMNVKKLTAITAATTGSLSGADQASATVADGPDDGPDPTDVVDVDENGIDTTLPGFVPGQQVSWRCGPGGTAVCPSVAVHDSTTAISADPEYPFVLGTIQAHRHGGSFIAAAAIQRGSPIGFSVASVNVRIRGRFDLNLGCDRKKFFDFSVPLSW